MLVKLILTLIIIFLLWSGMRQVKTLPPAKRKKLIVRGLLFGLGAIVLLGVLTGRMHWIGAIFAALIPLFRFGLGAGMKLLPFWLSRGGIAPFKTEYLDVKIQIKTGQVTGTVLKGEFAGKAVESLSPQQLQTLAEHCKDHDVKAYYLLRFMRNKSNGEQNTRRPDFGSPDREEALQILGLSGNPDRNEIVKAHRRLINKLHPDRGGSDFLAARVNQARDTLLKNL